MENFGKKLGSTNHKKNKSTGLKDSNNEKAFNRKSSFTQNLFAGISIEELKEESKKELI